MYFSSSWLGFLPGDFYARRSVVGVAEA